MPISHGVNKKALTIVPPPLPLTRFSPTLFVVLQEILYQPFLLCSDELLQKIMHFQSKSNFVFQLIASHF